MNSIIKSIFPPPNNPLPPQNRDSLKLSQSLLIFIISKIYSNSCALHSPASRSSPAPRVTKNALFTGSPRTPIWSLDQRGRLKINNKTVASWRGSSHSLDCSLGHRLTPLRSPVRRQARAVWRLTNPWSFCLGWIVTHTSLGIDCNSMPWASLSLMITLKLTIFGCLGWSHPSSTSS